MNSYDLKVLIQETKKNTAENIISELNKMICEAMKKKENLINCFEKGAIALNLYQHEIRYTDGYIGSLNDAIKNIEDDYKIGPRYILADSNLE